MKKIKTQAKVSGACILCRFEIIHNADQCRIATLAEKNMRTN